MALEIRLAAELNAGLIWCALSVGAAVAHKITCAVETDFSGSTIQVDLTPSSGNTRAIGATLTRQTIRVHLALKIVHADSLNARGIGRAVDV